MMARINACDREEKYEALREEFAENVNYLVHSMSLKKC